MPRVIEFKDEKAEKTFFENIDQIIHKNLFADEVRKRVARKDLFNPTHIAYDYVAQFNKFGNTQNKLNDLLDVLDSIKTAETTLDYTRKNARSAEAIKEGHDKFISRMTEIINRQPSFRELVSSFQQMSGASLGDDAMRLLNSVVQTVDNLSDRFDLEKRHAEYNKIAQNEINKLSSFNEIENEIKSFAQQCDKNNLDGTKLDEALINEENNLKTLNSELEALDNKEDQTRHNEKYIACSNRVQTLTEEGRQLVTRSYEIKGRWEELTELDNRISAMTGMLQKAEKQFNEYAEEELISANLIEALNTQIAEEEKKMTSALRRGNNYLNTDGKFVQHRVNIINQYTYENQVMQSVLQTFEAMNNGLPEYNLPPVDISESYRLYRNGVIDESMLSRDQLNGLNSYRESKRQLLEINPDYGDDFKKFEDDPQNKIPGDFEKIIGTKIRTDINDKNDVIKMYNEKTDFTKYNEAIDNIAKSQNSARLIEDLKAEKVIAENSLEEARRNKESVSADLQNWKTLPSRILGEAFPKGNATINDVRNVIASEKNKLSLQMKELKGRMAKNSEASLTEQKNLAALKEGLYSIKSSKLKLQITAQQARINTIKSLQKQGNDLKLRTQEANKEFADFKKSAECTPKEPSPYKKLADRLTDIQRNFKKVQSFWSSGMSPECKRMYDQIGKTLEQLKSPNPNAVRTQKALIDLADRSNEYLAAKKAQNVPKVFASQQRYWRLAFAEEMVNMSQNATYIINKADDTPGFKKHEEFMKMNFEKAANNPDAKFNELVDKHADAIKAHKSYERQIADRLVNQNNKLRKQDQPVQNKGTMTMGGF